MEVPENGQAHSESESENEQPHVVNGEHSETESENDQVVPENEPSSESEDEQVVPQIEPEDDQVVPQIEQEGDQVVPQNVPENEPSEDEQVVPQFAPEDHQVVSQIEQEGDRVVPQIEQEGDQVVPQNEPSIELEDEQVVPQMAPEDDQVVPQIQPDGEQVNVRLMKETSEDNWNQMLKKTVFTKQFSCPLGIDDLTVFKTQKPIKNLIMNNQFDDILRLINKPQTMVYFSYFPRLKFNLEQQKMIELCRKRDFTASLNYSNKFDKIVEYKLYNGCKTGDAVERAMKMLRLNQVVKFPYFNIVGFQK